MKKQFLFCCFLLSSIVMHAQINIPLPAFTKWDASTNGPGCTNVWLAKDSIVMTVKNKCVSEGIKSYRPAYAGLNEGTVNFTVPAGYHIQITITYKFKAEGAGDVFSYSGGYHTDEDISYQTDLKYRDGGDDLPESDGYRQAVLLINFTDGDGKAVQTTKALKSTIYFSFGVTASGGEPHLGSTAVIKAAKLELVK